MFLLNCIVFIFVQFRGRPQYERRFDVKLVAISRILLVRNTNANAAIGLLIENDQLLIRGSST